MFKRKVKEDSTITNKLGFHIGQGVRIAPRFFANNAIAYIDLGEGTVEGKSLGDKSTLPVLHIRFPFNHSFFVEPCLKSLLETSNAREGTISVLIQIHPVYLEEAKGKKHGKAG